MNYDSKPIITVKEARKKLGKVSDKLTDEEVEKLIEDLHIIAKQSLKLAADNRLKNKNGTQEPT